MAADTPAASQSNDPISITSNKMTVKSLEDIINFEGNVVINKGDLKILADRADVFLTSKKGDQTTSPSSSLLTGPAAKGDKEVTRIEAFGNVDVQQGDKHAKAQKGVYDKGKEEIVLTGDAEAWENDYRVKGRVITFLIPQNRSVVEGSQVVIQPGANQLKQPGAGQVKKKGK